MHLRRIAFFLLGGWLVGSVLMLFVTSANYDAADAVLRSPPPQAAKLLSTLPREQDRMLLFFMANEASRSYNGFWGFLQLLIGFGTGVSLFLERRTRFYSAGIGLMLLLVLFEWLVILPQLDWLGRSVDFVPWKAYSNIRDQYWNLRAVYLGVEIVKMLVGAGVVTALLIMRTRPRGIRRETGESELNEATPTRSHRSRRARGSSGEHTAGT
jgi:hypothetical protein